MLCIRHIYLLDVSEAPRLPFKCTSSNQRGPCGLSGSPPGLVSGNPLRHSDARPLSLPASHLDVDKTRDCFDNFPFIPSASWAASIPVAAANGTLCHSGLSKEQASGTPWAQASSLCKWGTWEPGRRLEDLSSSPEVAEQTWEWEPSCSLAALTHQLATLPRVLTHELLTGLGCPGILSFILLSTGFNLQ